MPRGGFCSLENVLTKIDTCTPFQYLQSMSLSPDVSEGTCNDGYCVYIEPRFWGGRGISFVTRPQIIEKAALEAMREHYQQEIVDTIASEAFEESQIPGKGVGLIATRFLPKGELLVSEPPSLMVHLDMRDDMPKERRLQMQREGVNSLPASTKWEALGLMGHWGGDQVEDILDTNSFTVTLYKALDHHALFTQTAVCFILKGTYV
jgi:hypothetical protein